MSAGVLCQQEHRTARVKRLAAARRAPVDAALADREAAKDDLRLAALVDLLLTGLRRVVANAKDVAWIYRLLHQRIPLQCRRRQHSRQK